MAGVEGAEEGLFDDEIVLAGVVEEIGGEDLWRGSGEFIAEALGRQGGDVEEGNVGEAVVEQPGGFVGIAAAGDEDGYRLVGKLFEVVLQGRGDTADIPAGISLAPALVPV